MCVVEITLYGDLMNPQHNEIKASFNCILWLKHSKLPLTDSSTEFPCRKPQLLADGDGYADAPQVCYGRLLDQR